MLFNSFQFLLFFILVWLLFLVTRGTAAQNHSAYRQLLLLHVLEHALHLCDLGHHVDRLRRRPADRKSGAARAPPLYLGSEPIL